MKDRKTGERSGSSKGTVKGTGEEDMWTRAVMLFFFFFFNATATTEISTLSLHDALPIYSYLSRLSTRSRIQRHGELGLTK